MTGPLSAIKGLLNHPLTDIGLAKFLADHKKGIKLIIPLKATQSLLRKSFQSLRSVCLFRR